MGVAGLAGEGGVALGLVGRLEGDGLSAVYEHGAEALHGNIVSAYIPQRRRMGRQAYLDAPSRS